MLTKAGLDGMFEIKPNRFDALAAVQTSDLHGGVK